MIDSTTRRKIQVSTYGTAGPYIMIPADQLTHVRRMLDEHHIQYWVDSDIFSLDGRPAVAVVNLGRSGDASKVQAILDDPA